MTIATGATAGGGVGGVAGEDSHAVEKELVDRVAEAVDDGHAQATYVAAEREGEAAERERRWGGGGGEARVVEAWPRVCF